MKIGSIVMNYFCGVRCVNFGIGRRMLYLCDKGWGSDAATDFGGVVRYAEVCLLVSFV